MMQQTGCAGVIVGRGYLGRPWLFGRWRRPSTARSPTCRRASRKSSRSCSSTAAGSSSSSARVSASGRCASGRPGTKGSRLRVGARQADADQQPRRSAQTVSSWTWRSPSPSPRCVHNASSGQSVKLPKGYLEDRRTTPRRRAADARGDPVQGEGPERGMGTRRTVVIVGAGAAGSGAPNGCERAVRRRGSWCSRRRRGRGRRSSPARHAVQRHHDAGAGRGGETHREEGRAIPRRLPHPHPARRAGALRGLGRRPGGGAAREGLPRSGNARDGGTRSRRRRGRRGEHQPELPSRVWRGMGSLARGPRGRDDSRL